MADAYRPKVTTSSSIKAAYGVKGKPSRLTTSKNQQPPGATQMSVLPRIDRRGELSQKVVATPLVSPPRSARDTSLSILLPPRRPSSKEATTSANEETSPTFYGDELEEGGPPAKAAWCTPRNANAPEVPTRSHVASFFAAPEGSGSGTDDSSVVAVSTPLRLQSVENSITANEERYRVDMEQLASNNDKFVEISMSANQHLEHVHSQFPNISEAFDQATSTLQSLSADISTLHHQHESAKSEMANQFEAAMSNNAEEMVTLAEAHANEKTEIIEAQERELQNADKRFREKMAELDKKYNEMEKKYQGELHQLRQTSESQLQMLQEKSCVEKEEQEQLAKAKLEALQREALKELDVLRTSTRTAYTDLQHRSQAELAKLQRTSADELAAVKKSLTAEIVILKQNAAANLAALADRSARELQEHREQSDETLQGLKYFYASEREHLLEKAAEEIARLRMFEIEQSARMETRRCQETKALCDELTSTKTHYSTQIEDLQCRYTSEIEVLKATVEAKRNLLLQTHATETKSIRLAAAQELSQSISSYEDRLHVMADAHAAEVSRSKEEAVQAREVLVTKYESDLVSLQNERAREKGALSLHYETKLETFKQASREEHDKSAKLHEAQVMELREAHASRVLCLEITMREQNKQADDTIRLKDAEIETKQGHIDVLEANEIAMEAHRKQYTERSQELSEEKSMALSELECKIWRLDQLNLEKGVILDSTSRALKAAEEDLQVKANTILELTYVVKSRDDEIEKLRNALLDTVQMVNTKTEILELTTETLTSKAKELEVTKNALRLESGKLSMVEESMSQKVGMLENTELKMESMRLNTENMRLEMKRMQMDMKLQLEHTEGEIELKNGEIRRLHGSQSELKQKNDFCQQTIERLESSLAFAQRQGEEAQRRIDLLRLEATQAADEMKKVCDELLGKDEDLVMMTREKQTSATEKQRLHIQLNNLTRVVQTLHEKVELHTMQAEEIQSRCQGLLEGATAEKDERLRSEKHLHMLEMSAAKDTIQRLVNVEERWNNTTSRLEAVTNEKHHLEEELKTLHETMKKLEGTDHQLLTARESIEMKDRLIENKDQELADFNKRLIKAEHEARHQLNLSRMECEDLMSSAYMRACSRNEAILLCTSLQSSISSLRAEKEHLMLSLGQEKRDIVSRAEDLQEKVAGLRKEGDRAANEISDLQHALIEKKKELEYLQENLGEQTTDTRKIKSALETLSSAHTELQEQFSSLSYQRERENRQHLDTIQSLQQNLESKTKQCKALQQSLDIQRQELDLLMVQHDSQVLQLTDGHRSEAVQLIESHRAQITQMRYELSKVTENHLAQVTKLKDNHRSEVSQLAEEHRSENARLKESHQAEIDSLTDDLRYQVSELVVDRLSYITEQTEEHRNEVARLEETHDREIDWLTEAHRNDLTLLTEERFSQFSKESESHHAEIARLKHDGEQFKEVHYNEVAQLTVDHLVQVTELSEDHRKEISRLKDGHDAKVAQLKEVHQSEMDQLIAAHQTHANDHCDGFGLEVRGGKFEDIDANLVDKNGNMIVATCYVRDHQQAKARVVNQHQIRLPQTTDDQIRVACARSLELMTLHVANQHAIELMEQHAMRIKQSDNKQLAELQPQHPQLAAEHLQVLATLQQMEMEHAQTLEKLKAQHARTLMEMKQQQEYETETYRERYDQTIAEQNELDDTKNTEIMHLRLTEEHLAKGNELLERSRVEEDCHAAALVVIRYELSDKLSALKSVEDLVVKQRKEISELQSRLQNTQQGVTEKDAVVAAKNATIDNIRKELNLLMETSKSTRSSEQFVALLRQQLETHLMEVYHVELNQVAGFVLEKETDLLGFLKELFAMRCYRGVAPQGSGGRLKSNKAVSSVDDVRERLQEFDRVAAALDRMQPVLGDNDKDASPSERVASLHKELVRLKLYVSKMFVSTNKTTENVETSTEAWVQLLDNLASLFERLAVPKELEKAFIRSRQIIDILNENEKLMLDAKSSCLKDTIQSMEDVGRLFAIIDQVLARAREVTRSDKFLRLEDLTVLFDEWVALHKELDESHSADASGQGFRLDDASRQTMSTESYLRSAEILAPREEAAAFVQRCKNVLLITEEDDSSTPDDIVASIEQLMTILQHFELLQPKLGSPRRQPTGTCQTPTLENKVAAVLAFVEELQLMADFAQNILSDENKNESEPASNESSSSSLAALQTIARMPSSTPTLDELQIEVDLAVDDAMQSVDQSACEFSNEEGESQREAFFSSRPPSPFLADSLMDISLVMSDHHRLLSQTARWVAKSRQGGARSQTFSVGTEISRLVREHCALLSLSRRLFKMKDPRQELVSLLEGIALLDRMAGRLALFQPSSTRGSDEISCTSIPDSYIGDSITTESATSLLVSDVDLTDSLSRPILTSIGDMARHLQDYDYFLQHIKVDEGQLHRENNSPVAINIEALVQEINDRVMLVEQSRELLGLNGPVDGLFPFVAGAQEVLRQAKQLRESSVCYEKCSLKTDTGLQAIDGTPNSDHIVGGLLSEMDAIVEDLRSYNELLAWMKQVLPLPESVKSVTDLMVRVNESLAQVEVLTRDNMKLAQDTASLKSDLEYLERDRDQLLEEASKEGILLQELAVLGDQVSLSSVQDASTRIELLQALVQQQQRARDIAQHRRADLETDTAFLRQHDLLSEQTDDTDEEDTTSLPVSTRLEIYNRLLGYADNLRLEKSEMESALNEGIRKKTEKIESLEGELIHIRQEMENALAEERIFLQSKALFSSILDIHHGTSFSRIEVYQQLHDKIAHLLGEKQVVETSAAREMKFLQTNGLLTPEGEGVNDVPTAPVLSSIRMEIFQHLVDSRSRLRHHEEDLALEIRFLQENSLSFNLNEPRKSRLAVYEALLAGQNALIEEKLNREVAVESEKAFLASHGVPPFENPMEIYEQFVAGRKQLADLATELEIERKFLVENQLCTSDELSDGIANLTTPFSSSFRLRLYRKFLKTEAQAREATQQLKENMEQRMSRQIAADECVIAALTAKVEKLEASLMWWQETAYASQHDWDQMLLQEEEKRRNLIQQHKNVHKQAAEDHMRTLDEVVKARDDVVALTSATHAEALEHATKEHETRLAVELHKQAQQFEFASFVHGENEVHKPQAIDASPSTAASAAITRARLLEKFAKRDTTTISMIYKAIRLTTDILSTAPAATVSSSTPRSVAESTDVTQMVIACVQELKTLKEFLVQSLEQVAKDDDQAPYAITKAQYAKLMADAVARTTADKVDKECAIDLALCSHREFMSFAEVQLLARQEELDKALGRVYEKLKTAAANGAFTADQEKLLALELEVTRAKEGGESVECKLRLNEEYYRRLLDERKEMEIAQTATVEGLREECNALRQKLEQLVQQQQTGIPQFRPPSNNPYTVSPRASVMTPQTPRVLKSAAVSNTPMPMRPERPRGGGSAHKDRFMSDLERETGQRRTNTAARRLNEWRVREEGITENPGSQLEQDFRAIQEANASRHPPSMEAIAPPAMAAPATAPGSSLQNQELWYQGVRSIHYVSFFISTFHVPRQQLFRVEVFNSDTEQQQTVYVTWTEMQTFLEASRKAARLGIALPADPELAVTVPQHVRAEIMDVLFERVRVYGEGTENILLGFE